MTAHPQKDEWHDIEEAEVKDATQPQKKKPIWKHWPMFVFIPTNVILTSIIAINVNWTTLPVNKTLALAGMIIIVGSSPLIVYLFHMEASK